uniref:Regulatory protein zeste n=1 Tax=Romanomermis culicivorax TaxID=13658 RepID=A0A915HG92_ROMCU
MKHIDYNKWGDSIRQGTTLGLFTLALNNLQDEIKNALENGDVMTRLYCPMMSTSIEQKLLIPEKIKELKDILFCKFNEKVMNQDKQKAWQAVKNFGISTGNKFSNPITTFNYKNIKNFRKTSAKKQTRLNKFYSFEQKKIQKSTFLLKTEPRGRLNRSSPLGCWPPCRPPLTRKALRLRETIWAKLSGSGSINRPVQLSDFSNISEFDFSSPSKAPHSMKKPLRRPSVNQST